MLLRRCFQSSNTFKVLKTTVLNKPKLCNARKIVISELHCRITLNNSEQEKFSNKVSTISNSVGTTKPDPDPGAKDALAEKLKNQNLHSTLRLTEAHHAVMNNKHLIMVMDTIYNNLKSKPYDIEEIKSSVGFRKLCSSIMKRIRFFDIQEVVIIFKVLKFLNVPEDSTIFQGICQMLRHNLNNLTIQEITFIEYIFQKGNKSKSPLTEAIKMALPVVLKSKLDAEIDTENLSIVVESWTMAQKYNINDPGVEKLHKIILMKSDQLTKDQVLAIFFKIASMRPIEAQRHQELAQVIAEFMCNFIVDLPFTRTLAVISNLMRNKNPYLKNIKLLTLLSHKSVKENWELWKLCQLLYVYLNYEFVSTEVLDLVARRIEESPKEVSKDPRVSVLSVVESFSMADYLPNGSNTFLQHVLNSSDKISELENKVPHLLVKFVMHLVILKAGTESLLNKVLDPDFVDLVLRKTPKVNVANILQCYRVIDTAARLEIPHYNGSFLDAELLKRSVMERAEFVKPIDLVLKNFLEIGLGGSQFMLSGLWTHFGHFIDHLVVMRKGDYPVALGSALTNPPDIDGLNYIEDVALPPDAKVLAILVARPEWFTSNPSRQTGWASFHHRTLDSLGYNPITLGPPMITKGKSQDLIGHVDNEDY